MQLEFWGLYTVNTIKLHGRRCQLPSCISRCLAARMQSMRRLAMTRLGGQCEHCQLPQE
jgi:hypothetical protein